MTVEELIRELSCAEGFYNEVEIIDEPKKDEYAFQKAKYDYDVIIDNSSVYIMLKGK